MNTYGTKQRVFFAGLALLLMLVAAVLYLQLGELGEPEEAVAAFFTAVASCGVAVGALRIVATGTSWPWFERIGGAPWAKRLAGWGLLIVASLALVWYAKRHH